ncbi:bifunctional glutamate N-acetyltransferase/amino-acid acetyltransferase ArgJ [Enterococcus gallinarum]|uniref:bifunctional glutamate N-acetyltransferase/amino-acid acetyltransferase ArgJ n=1 Tax=Enterococcus gallinarum TaxID=1353 RepID=UPI001D179549|nr:bifunctional glutamate N-acetyltransferase/amino-acid acetyltransferase ArgJ [Enterococcus gallinarum]MCC4045028.1 bifunctional glutamate N-acetyltransferase/amino-acid acetyltransferase ArgJ [Enterococcus gallinarum]
MKEIIGTIASPKGFYADGIHCGVKKRKADLGWLFSEVPASAAAVFTTNQVQAAPVLVTREQLKTGKLRGVIVNSGNANACTGEQGIADAREMIALAAAQAGVASEEVAVASTGIIGRPLPMATIAAGIRQLSHSGSPTGFQKAILTTDLVEKNQVIQTEIAGHTVTIAGCAKGSGMIHPNMATMLAFVTTDAAIAPSLLQSLLRKLTEVTFNQITVDGDTSTNDMVLVLANGQAGNPPIEENTFAYKQFKKMLQTVLTTLAKAIAKDGEGATKLIEAETKGAPTDLAARMISKTIVGSPLVKTAIYGKDPNWGRILCAIGYSGQRIDPTNVAIELAAIPVFAGGSPLDYDETLMEERLTASEVKINVILQEGAGRGKAWGCDLTYDYVKINALYHT